MNKEVLNIKVDSMKIYGLKPFDCEYTFYFNSQKCLITGRNGSGKTMILNAIEFFFNENKYFKSLIPDDFHLPKASISLTLIYNQEKITIKKTLKITKSSITIERVDYSQKDFSPFFLDFLEESFVYLFTSDRLLSEKDNEFDFIKNSLLNYLNLKTVEDQLILKKTIESNIYNYKNTFLSELEDKLSFSFNINLKNGLGLKLIWKNSPFTTLGSGERKAIALNVLYSYVKSRKKGPSIILVDSIENHFDYQMLLNNLKIINNLPTSLQVITSFSQLVFDTLNDYARSVVIKNDVTNRIGEIDQFTMLENIVF